MSETVPYEQLERHFHEPARLAVLSLLANSSDGIVFTELKEELGLTFGNLDRHLKMLSDAGIVSLKKEGRGPRARTTVCLTEEGQVGFLHYLDNLERILKTASQSLRQNEGRRPESEPGLGGAPAVS